MNTCDTPRPDSSDWEFEGLLKEFFRREMPVELRELPTAPEMSFTTIRKPVEQSGRPQSAYPAALLGLVAVAMSLMLAAAALWSPSTKRDVRVSTKDATKTEAPTPTPREQAVDVNAPIHIVGPSVVESLLIERYDTPDGPVELRTNVRWTNVSVFEPDSGTEVELMFPELEIEIFGIDDDGEIQNQDE